jgi:alpha-acetolactate decarboxylase
MDYSTSFTFGHALHNPPYLNLVEAVRTGVQFKKERLAGFVVDFRFPHTWPVFDLLFVSQDKSTKGHVRELKATNITLSVQYLPKVVALLPSKNPVFVADDFS